MRNVSALVTGLSAVALGLVLCSPMAGAQARQVRHTTPQVSSDADFNLSPLETRVLGQRTWLRGGPAALRVIVTDHNTGKPLKANVTLTLQRLENGKAIEPTHALVTGQTNGVGTLEAGFTAPSVAPGAYQLNVSVKSPLGADSFTQPIQMQESMQLMLTADKPLYQPGQIIHLRALALDMATRQAAADLPVTFEVEDARGNKVFKKKETLSKFGIAGTDFVLADEVNMGTFTLRAVLPQGQTEKKVRVERYVLPKFKTTVTTDKPYYLPGETVKGTVQANYFFGKPVSEGQVTLTVNTLIIGVEKIGEVKGKTDAAGKYAFEYKLPNAFVGQPFEQGKAVVEFTGDLKDTADHKQTVQTTVPVVKDPITLVLVPEHRGLVPDVENRVFIAVAT
ncbi:MAG TPA: MG2 domain-containing protein, partial [Chthonomonadaceae bacterium]|nr:MG2 domain-containing protein [Chthonomonadaceae bacterium]